MKKISLLVLIIIIVNLIGCNQNITSNNSLNQQKQIPDLTEEEAMRIVSEASGKFNIITLGGRGIADCIFENKEMIEINDNYYYYFGTCLDTVDKFNAYLSDVFTDNSIEVIMKTLGIIEYEGKLLSFNADAGGGTSWGEAKIISLKQNNETAEVEFEVPPAYEEDDSGNYTIKMPFKYIQNRGWLIDTEDPFDLY